MIEIIKNRRFIAANVLAGLTLAATSGCFATEEQSLQEKIDASYDSEFVDHPESICYDGIIDHPSAQEDLLDELQQRSWLDVDSLSGAYAAAGNINTILEALHESGDASESSNGNYPIQPGDTYEFCIKDNTVGAGHPTRFTSIDYQ